MLSVFWKFLLKNKKPFIICQTQGSNDIFDFFPNGLITEQSGILVFGRNVCLKNLGTLQIEVIPGHILRQSMKEG